MNRSELVKAILLLIVAFCISFAANADDTNVYQEISQNAGSVNRDRQQLNSLYGTLREHQKAGVDTAADLQAIAHQQQALQDDMGRYQTAAQTYKTQTGQNVPYGVLQQRGNGNWNQRNGNRGNWDGRRDWRYNQATAQPVITTDATNVANASPVPSAYPDRGREYGRHNRYHGRGDGWR